MSMKDEDRLAVDVWSDIMCPFCYMGDALLAQALERFSHAAAVDVRYRSYQLMPHRPADHPVDLVELLVREKGFPRARAEAMNAQVAARGREVGLEYRFDRALAVNTRAAHRLSHFARREGKQHAFMLRLFRAYFMDGLHLGRHDVLAELAVEVGLDRTAALEALTTGAFEDEVAADEKQAREYSISGVPFFILDGKYAISGAQSADAFLDALETAWEGKFGNGARQPERTS